MKKLKPVQLAKKNLKVIKGILITWLHMKQLSVRTVACRYPRIREVVINAGEKKNLPLNVTVPSLY